MGEKIHIVEGIRANDRLAFEEIAFDVISVGGTKDEVVVRQDPTFGTWTYEFSGIEEAPLYDPSNPDTHIARGQQQMIFIDWDNTLSFRSLENRAAVVMLRYSEASGWLGRSGQMLRSTSA